MKELQQKTAGFWIRFWAFVIDIAVIAAITVMTAKPLFLLFGLSVEKFAWYAPYSIVSVIVYYAYFVLMTKIFRQTLGKMIFGLVVQKDDGQALDWATLLFREVVGRFINGTFLSIPYIFVAFSPQNKSIADYIADTTVLHEALYREVTVPQQPKALISEQKETI